MSLNKKDLQNIILRETSGNCFYFNSEGIYCRIPKNESKHLTSTHFKCYLLGIDNEILAKKAICLLKEGDTLETLEKILSSIKLDSRPKPEGINRFIIKIETPFFIRTPENNKKHTFDIIHIDVYIISNWETDRKKYIEDHQEEITTMVINKLKNNKTFQHFGIPVNFLKISKIVFSSKKSLLEYTFELKS